MTDAAAVPNHDGPTAEQVGDGGSGFPSIIIQGDALARIEEEMGADTTAEYGGVLVGNAAPSTNFVLIAGSLAAIQPRPDPPPTDDSSSDRDPSAPGNFTFTAGTLEALARQVATTYPGQRIVGWYHSHPRSGIFLSAHDLYIQSAFFAQPWQVCYVYDSIYGQRGFFGWSGREVVRVPNWEITTVAQAAGADLPVSTPAHTTPGVELGAELANDSDADSPVGFVDVEAGGAGPAGKQVPVVAGSPGPVTGKRPIGAWIIAAFAIAVIVIVAAVVRSRDDNGTTVGTGNEPNSSATVASSAASATTDAATTAVTDTATTVEQTSTTAVGETSTTGAGAITLPATPTVVEAPASRVGLFAGACVQTSDRTYRPPRDCFVPLNNGNILVFVSGSLRCVDPDGFVVAARARQFTVGNADDPLVLIVDNQLTQTCLNLDYAQNVLTGGSQTFDGLCGGFGIQINDATRRCFAQNPVSGAMVAVVRSTEKLTSLVSSCTTAAAEKTLAPLLWSVDAVSTAWRVDSVVFDSAQNQFVANASRGGATATATFGCG